MALVSGWGYEEEGLHPDEMLSLGTDSGSRQFQRESHHQLSRSFLHVSCALPQKSVSSPILKYGISSLMGLELEFTPRLSCSQSHWFPAQSALSGEIRTSQAPSARTCGLLSRFPFLSTAPQLGGYADGPTAVSRAILIQPEVVRRPLPVSSLQSGVGCGRA